MSAALDPFGWDERVASLFAGLDLPGATPGRVVRVDRGSCVVVTGEGPVRASAFGTSSRSVGMTDVPAAGDWVALAADTGDERAVIAVAPRWSAISRKNPDEGVTAEQVLAANIDVVAVVCGLDRPFGHNRVERMLAAAWESGAAPAIVLTKVDVAPDLEQAVSDASSVAGDVPVLVTSMVSGAGLGDLRELLRPSRTLALLGLSGTGKSSLVNRLVGEEVQSTGTVRRSDVRGRHTTSSRQLVPVPGGGVVLDTPGLRSLPLWDAGSGVTAVFDDVEELAEGCRFRDCRHEKEPGCAVRSAVEEGGLDPRRVASYHKLVRELASLEVRQAEQARRAGAGRSGPPVKGAGKVRSRPQR